jgi:hypothetical protein
MKVSRRQILFGLAAFGWLARAAPAIVQKRRYRVDATVSVLGAPLITRQNVGTAFLLLHETDEADRRIVRLHFAGGSNAERAHGIVYAGSMEESVIERCHAPVRANYFGFVTAPDDHAEPVRRVAFEHKNSASFVAVEGHHEGGCARRARVCIVLPGQTWRDIPDLIAQMRSRFLSTSVAGQELFYPGTVPATFLYTILAAVRSAQSRSAWSYVHNGHSYRLECDKAAEPGGVQRFTGRIHDETSKQKSSFRLWLEPGSDLPARIEFQPRSYLRITLQKEES